MKILFTLLCALTLAFNQGWNDGYHAGYCANNPYCISPIPPIPPIPYIGFDTYKDGFTLGVIRGKHDRDSTNYK